MSPLHPHFALWVTVVANSRFIVCYRADLLIDHYTVSLLSPSSYK